MQHNDSCTADGRSGGLSTPARPARPPVLEMRHLREPCGLPPQDAGEDEAAWLHTDARDQERPAAHSPDTRSALAERDDKPPETVRTAQRGSGLEVPHGEDSNPGRSQGGLSAGSRVRRARRTVRGPSHDPGADRLRHAVPASRHGALRNTDDTVCRADYPHGKPQMNTPWARVCSPLNALRPVVVSLQRWVTHAPAPR